MENPTKQIRKIRIFYNKYDARYMFNTILESKLNIKNNY